MSVVSETPQKITFRRYKDGDNKVRRLNEQDFSGQLYLQMSDLHPVHAALPGQLPGG